MEDFIITDKSFKYNLEKLDSTSDEFILVDGYFRITANRKVFHSYMDRIKTFEIYKLTENNPIMTVKEKTRNLILFHGTNELEGSEAVTEILKECFKNSESRWLGKGVYMSDCSTIALGYTFQFCDDRFVFVNEILDSEKIQIFHHDRNLLSVFPKTTISVCFK